MNYELQQTFVSSAFTWHKLFTMSSLMKMTKSTGPRTLPWGTPTVTGVQSKWFFLLLMLLYVQKPWLLGMGSPGRQPWLSHSSWTLTSKCHLNPRPMPYWAVPDPYGPPTPFAAAPKNSWVCGSPCGHACMRTWVFMCMHVSVPTWGYVHDCMHVVCMRACCACMHTCE